MLFFSLKFGSHLLSHPVTSAVPSAAWVLTIVFGMGTGVTPKRIATEMSCIQGSSSSRARKLAKCEELGSYKGSTLFRQVLDSKNTHN